MADRSTELQTALNTVLDGVTALTANPTVLSLGVPMRDLPAGVAYCAGYERVANTTGTDTVRARYRIDIHFSPDPRVFLATVPDVVAAVWAGLLADTTLGGLCLLLVVEDGDEPEPVVPDGATVYSMLKVLYVTCEYEVTR